MKMKMRQRDRQKETDRKTEIERLERMRHTEYETERQIDREGERQRETERDRETDDRERVPWGPGSYLSLLCGCLISLAISSQCSGLSLASLN